MKAETNSEKVATKGHTYVQWISGVIANSSLFTYGLLAGWLSPSAKVLQSQSSPTGEPLSDSTLGWLGSLMPITAMFFVPLFAYLADRIGRKKSILLMTVPQLGCWLLKLFATNLTYLIVARILFGITAAGSFTAVPMYNKEIAQDNIRGRMGSMLVFFLNLVPPRFHITPYLNAAGLLNMPARRRLHLATLLFGIVRSGVPAYLLSRLVWPKSARILTMYALGAYLEYYRVLHIVTGIPVLTFFCLLKYPESPGYLVKIGRFDEAAKSLSCLRGLPIDDKHIQSEMDNMKKQDEYYKSLPNLSLIVILKDKAWRKAYLISSLLIGVQASSGNFALITYGSNIVSSVVFMNSDLQTLSFPIIMMLGSVVSVCIMEKVKRKTILVFSYVVSALSLGSLATIMLLPKDSVPGWFTLLAIPSSMFVYAVAVLPGPFIVMAEIFNIQIRAKLMGLVSAQAWSMCFIQLAAFAPISAALGMYTYFYICTGVYVLGIVVVLVLMPETRGKSVEEIENELRR